jgi:hypothetical protein
MENKETFVMYKSYIDAVNKLPDDKDKLELLLGICNYSMTGVEPIFNSFMAEAIFIAIKPTIGSAKSRYQASVENGRKGGAPKGNDNAKKKQPKTTQEQPNETTQNNLYVDVYVDDDVYDNVDVDVDVNVDVNVDGYVYEDDNVLITDVCSIIETTPFRSDYTTIKQKVLFQNGNLDDKILSIVKYFEDTFGKTPMSVQDIKNKLNQLQLN